MVVLTCPNCSATLEIDESRQFAFCQYCGTKVTNLNNSVEINRTVEIQNLLIRALEFEQKGYYDMAQEYCNRVLDIDPGNVTAQEIQRRMPGYLCGKNLTIEYQSVHDDKYKLRITLDGRNWNTLNKNETLQLELPVGKHKIVFSGTRQYIYELKILNVRQKIKILYKADKRKNTIEEFLL